MTLTVTVDSQIHLDGTRLPEAAVQEIFHRLTIANPAKEKAEREGAKGWEKLPDEIDLWEASGDELIVPRGFAFELVEVLSQSDIELEWKDERMMPRGFVSGSPINLYPEQEKIVEAILELEQGIIKAPTGSGKTVSMLEIFRRVPGPGIVIVNTKEIAAQWISRCRKFLGPDYPVSMIGDGKFEIAERGLTVAIQATLWSRREKLAEEGFFDRFVKVALDECFPAGTMVGDKKIENLRPGDLVPSFDEKTGKFLHKKVVNTMKSKPHKMVSIHLSDGRVVNCTAGHPFLTEQGWLPAEMLSGCMVRYDSRHEISLQDVLHPSRDPHEVSERSNTQARMGVLHQKMRQGVCCSNQQRNGIQDQSQICVSSDEEKESNAQPTVAPQNVSDAQSNQTQTPYPGRQRGRIKRARRNPFTGNWVEVGDSQNWMCSRGERVPDSLQGGFGRFRHQTCDRDRWPEPLQSGTEETGSQEGEVSAWAWVDRVEVLEPGSDGRFGGVCQDGFVYNIEVEDTHTYVVDGLVSHNCHHATAATYNDIFARFNAKVRIGASATPEKTGEFRLAEVVIGPIVVEVTEEDIGEGITKPVIEVIETKLGAKAKGEKANKWTKSRSFNFLVKKLVADQERIELVANEILINHTNNANIVLSKRIAHLEAIYDALLSGGFPEDQLLAMIGNHSLEEREEAIELTEHASCVLLTTLADEALDAPRLDRCHLVFPTKNPELVIQQIGRVRRLHPDKVDSIVLDYCDPQIGMFLSQYMTRRHEVYNPRGFQVIKRKVSNPHDRIQ